MSVKFLHKISPSRHGSVALLFPAAGRGSVAYLGKIDLPLELSVVVLPGRERRMGETPSTRMDEVTGQICDEIDSIYPEREVILQGHSLGAYVGHAVAAELEKRGRKAAALGVAGAEAPIQAPPSPKHDLSDEMFISAVEELGGTPPELFADPVLRKLFLPTLRADFAQAETYSPGDAKVSCPIFASYGFDDMNVNPLNVEKWKYLTSANFISQGFDGDHFYQDSHINGILRITADLGDVAKTNWIL